MTTTIDYQKQGLDFLTETNTAFKVTFLKTGNHFEDEKNIHQQRDIYEIELTRGKRSYKFQFGQSINNSGKYLLKDSRLEAEFGRKFISEEEFKKKRLPLNDRQWCIVKNPNYSQPTPYDVFSCLTKYDPGTFEGFCSEFGYDTDSRKAEKTYKAVKDEYLQLCTLYSPEELEKMMEIQ